MVATWAVPTKGEASTRKQPLQPSCPQLCQSPAHEARLSLLCSPSSHPACLLNPAGIPSLWYPSMSQERKGNARDKRAASSAPFSGVSLASKPTCHSLAEKIQKTPLPAMSFAPSRQQQTPTYPLKPSSKRPSPPPSWSLPYLMSTAWAVF